MSETMSWLASFFPTWGVRLICLTIIFAVAGWIAGQANAPRTSRALLLFCAVVFVLFIITAAFYAFHKG